ncbi:MAG: phage/plasmid primase, P4 family [Candidatus Thermoplasmatota archaeon]|nr:phage/plasmid primase, P4 family [Candidatus Thermoplasmatota archaeon]
MDKEGLLEKYKVIKRTDSGTISINCPKLAELIMKEYNYNFMTVNDTKEIYYYGEKLYRPDGESLIKNLVESYLVDLSTEHRKNEVVGYIRDHCFVTRDIFDPSLDLINMENGIYDIAEEILKPHSPLALFINKIPIKYNPDANCPKIKKFLSQVVYEKDIPTLQEFFGYCLYRRYHIHKAVMLVGGGKNGKSTLLRLLIKFLGEENVSNKELQSLIYNRFSLASLFGKYANIASDISDKSLKITGVFKMITGEDRVETEKKFKDSFGFTNYAKLIFSANKVPMAEDESYAYYRRWILISFPNTFEVKKCNPNLLDEIATEDEMSGLFNWAIEGLKRLLKNGNFSSTKSIEEIMEQYKIMSNPIYQYCNDFLTNNPEGYILKSELWEHYVKWCKSKKLPIIPKNILTQKLSEQLPEMRIGKRGQKGKQKPCYINISWNKEKQPNITIQLNRFENNQDACSTEQNS